MKKTDKECFFTELISLRKANTKTVKKKNCKIISDSDKCCEEKKQGNVTVKLGWSQEFDRNKKQGSEMVFQMLAFEPRYK